MRRVCVVVLLVLLNPAVLPAQDITLLPPEVTLDGPGSRQRILVERMEGGTARGPETSVTLQSADPQIAAIDGSSVVPVSNGKTSVVAIVDGQPVGSVGVIVRNAAIPQAWTFRNHVEPVLARLGCNSGACHGALAGKGGFRLSLRGYNPDQDYFNITQQHLGRRVEPANPGMSLILTKPTAAVAHKGGKRMETDSLNYRILAEWIADGAAGPQEDDATLRALKVFPSHVILTATQTQPILVQAEYSDDRIEDVTHWARFTSSNEAVVRVNDEGIATVVGSGEGAITAAFGSEIRIARVTVPFPQTVAPSIFTKAERRNFVDELVLKQLEQLNLEPSPRSADTTFVRRAFLDTIGVLPTSQEVRDFVANDRATKRDELIESLLARPEFVDFWTYHWSDVLMINGNLLRQQPVKAYYQWIRTHVENNTPWDVMVRELVTAKGSSLTNGATNFYALHQKPEDMAENVSQAFLGLSIGCARCHNHPLEKWTNDQYYAFANLFSRVRAKGWGGDGRNGDGQRTLITVVSGELNQPRTGKPQPPTPLDGTSLEFDDPRDRREHLADWLVSDENTLFARSVTNRVWRNFMGVGLVEQVDDMRASNPASNEELLAALASYLVEQEYDLKSLMRLILQSETYQRSSQTLESNKEDKRHYSRFFPRRLMAEVMLDAASQVTNVPTTFNQIGFVGGDVQETKYYEEGTRALQLYDSAVNSYFLKTFGRNQRRITCECERSNDPSMVQVLHISNGKTINEKLSTDNNRITQWQERFKDDDKALIEEMFLTTLSRLPADIELQELLAELSNTAAEDRRPLLEDILWSMLSSREFLFTH
jgi:hypothetical protein